MFRVFLLDDEPSIINWLRTSINWEEFGCIIEGYETNALTALSYVKEHPVDLLITDVCMPDLNGLDLIQEVKHYAPQTHVVIISAYSRFEYVKQALKYGVENYLLKPIDIDELKETLKNLFDFTYNKIEEKAIDIFRENILIKWISQSKKSPDFRMQAELAGLNLNCQLYCALVFNLSEPSLSEQIIETISSYDITCYYLNISTTFVVLLGCNDEAILSKTIHSLSIKLTENDILCVGPVVSKYTDLALSYKTACRFALIGDVFSDQLIYCKNYEFYLHENSSLSRLFSKFALDIKSGLTQNIKTSTFKLWSKMKECISAKPICICLASYLFSLDDNAKQLLSNPSIQSYMQNLKKISDEADYFEWINQLIILYINEHNKASQHYHPYIKQILIQISHHYSDNNISIKTFANEFSVNPSYLGQLFRSQTGKYFNDYLLSVRLDSAKIYLSNTDLKIGEIAEKVGFNSQSYFNRIFKSTTGVSPLEYRINNRIE